LSSPLELFSVLECPCDSRVGHIDCGWENPFSAAGDVVVALRLFLLSASDSHAIGLDGAIGVECRSAVTLKAVLEAHIFIDGVFALGAMRKSCD